MADKRFFDQARGLYPPSQIDEERSHDLHGTKLSTHVAEHFAAVCSEESPNENCSESQKMMFRTVGFQRSAVREGSGIRVGGTAGHGLTISTYIKDDRNLPWQKPSRALI